MKKTLPLMVISVLCFLTAHAQDYNIANEIAGYTPSKSHIIAQGRNLILDEFIADNISKVEDAFLYLTGQAEDTDYQVFYPHEKIILACWLRHYDLALKEISALDSLAQVPLQERRGRIAPPQDMLWSKMYERAHLYLESVYLNIQQAPLSREEKDMLSLMVRDLLENNSTRITDDKQLEINQACTDFLNAYPDSPYARFVREQLRFEFAPANWGFEMAWSLGYLGHAGDLAHYLPGNGFMGLDIDIYYKRFMFGGLINIAFDPKIRQDITFAPDLVWPANTSSTNMSASLMAGFQVADSKDIAFTPYIGIGAFTLEPAGKTRKDYPELRGHSLERASLLFGFFLDYKLKPANRPSIHSYIPLRLRASYHLNLNQDVLIHGDMFSVSLGIGVMARGTKRKL